MNGNGITDIIREGMFLVSLKASNNLFSHNKKNNTESTQQDINDSQLQGPDKNQLCRPFRTWKRLLLFLELLGLLRQGSEGLRAAWGGTTRSSWVVWWGGEFCPTELQHGADFPASAV